MDDFVYGGRVGGCFVLLIVLFYLTLIRLNKLVVSSFGLVWVCSLWLFGL